MLFHASTASEPSFTLTGDLYGGLCLHTSLCPECRYEHFPVSDSGWMGSSLSCLALLPSSYWIWVVGSRAGHWTCLHIVHNSGELLKGTTVIFQNVPSEDKSFPLRLALNPDLLRLSAVDRAAWRPSSGQTSSRPSWCSQDSWLSLWWACSRVEECLRSGGRSGKETASLVWSESGICVLFFCSAANDGNI